MENEKSLELQKVIDTYLDELIVKFYTEAKNGNHIVSSESINLDYYVRHQIEIILRLRLKRCADALTVHHFTKTDPHMAKRWAEYAEDEMCHDDMFAADLVRMGVSKETIYGTDPFFATKLLQGYFYYVIEHVGKPLANVISSYFIEYTTKKTQPTWLENVAKHLGSDMVKGARAHLNHDIHDNHSQFVWDFVWDFVKDEPDPEKTIRGYMEEVYKLFLMYFDDLSEQLESGGVKYGVTIEKDAELA